MAICGACGLRLAQPAPPPPASANDAMPDWLRQFQDGPGQGPGQGDRAPSAGMPQAHSFSARNLMSEEALPDWLRNSSTGAPQSPSPSFGQQPPYPQPYPQPPSQAPQAPLRASAGSNANYA